MKSDSVKFPYLLKRLLIFEVLNSVALKTKNEAVPLIP